MTANETEKQRLINWKFSCTAKNSRTTWVRGCRGTSRKTWGRKTVAAQIQLYTKCMVRQNTVARIEWRKTAGNFQLIYYVIYYVFELFLKMFIWKNVFSSCFLHWRFVLCEISRNEKGFFATVSNTEKSVIKRCDIRVYFNTEQTSMYFEIE